MVTTQVNSYYDGSRIFSPLAGYFSISVDQLNFVISQFASLALASLFRTHLHPTRTKPETRHTFGLVFGLIIGYFLFGTQALHLAGLPALCYLVIRTTKPTIAHRIVLFVALFYLSFVHLHRQIYDYGSTSLDITGPLMVVTQKVTSLAFCIFDGTCRDEKDLTKSQKIYAVKRVPTPLEYFSYVLQFPSLMAGPALWYKDYIEFIEGKNFAKALGDGKGDGYEPSPFKAVMQKVIFSVLFATAYVKFMPQFNIQAVKGDEFVENTSLMYKFWYLSVATLLVRFKYYFAWLFADAICNNSGIGFNGFNEDGSPSWNKFTNVDVVKFEFSTSLKESIEAWNIGTNNWLRSVVYERVDKYSTILTYALSALWHGFYPGYYLTFASGALFTFAARTMRRTFRNYFTGNTELKFFYDVITFITTRLVMSYITFTFVLLEFYAGVRVYIHMYMCLHIFAFLALFLVPHVVPKGKPGDSSHLAATSDSIANVLRQASPITNSVSNHHD